MYEFHLDKEQYINIQLANAEKNVLPWIDKYFPLQPGMRVLEIGCGMGSVVKAFVNRGCKVVGVEMNTEFIGYARQWLQPDIEKGDIQLIASNVYDIDIAKETGGRFDLIVMKDVIEHIHNQERLMGYLQKWLKPSGMIFIAFPPWQMPFGGHQQICRNKWLAKMPYYHLLPVKWYKALLEKYREQADVLLEIKETGISIERFEKICKKTGYQVFQNEYYLINPVYEYKFGWKGRKQLGLIKAIPYLRNFFTTCVFYLIKPK